MGPPPAMRETTARLARLPSFEADALKSVKKHTAAQKIVLKVRELLGYSWVSSPEFLVVRKLLIYPRFRSTSWDGRNHPWFCPLVANSSCPCNLDCFSSLT